RNLRSVVRIFPALLSKGRALETILRTERGVASRGSGSQPPATGARHLAPRHYAPRARRPLAHPDASPGREPRAPGPKSPRWERREAGVPRRGTQGASAEAPCLPPRAGHGCLASTRRPPALRHPSFRVREAKVSKPGRKNAPRERDGLFDIMSRNLVMRGLDPPIHLLREKVIAKMDGLPGRARQ